MSRLEQFVEEKVRAILADKDSREKAEAEARAAEALRLAEQEQAREQERQEALAGIEPAEAECWAGYRDDLRAIVARIAERDSIAARMGAYGGKPRFYIPGQFRAAVKAELARVEKKERIASRDPAAEAKRRAKRRAEYLRAVKAEQERAAKNVVGDEGQKTTRIAATDAAIRQTEGRGPRVIDPEGIRLKPGFGFGKKEAPAGEQA